MAAERVTEHVFRIQSGDASMFLIDVPEGPTLIDTGFPESPADVLEALEGLGRRPEEITDILVTHCHPDHAGGLAEIKRASGARVWMHPVDAEMTRKGTCFRPWKPAPGEHNAAFVRDVISHVSETVEAAEVEEEAIPGERIPVAGGIEVIGTPGHTLGHIVFLWPGDGGVAFIGDAAKNFDILEPGTIYEDFEQGVESLRALARHDFEVACFAHGSPIVGGASQAFRRVWG